MAPRFLTLADVAETLNISAAPTYALVRSGDLPAIKIGGRGQWRVEATALEEFIARKYVQTREFVRVRIPSAPTTRADRGSAALPRLDALHRHDRSTRAVGDLDVVRPDVRQPSGDPAPRAVDQADHLAGRPALPQPGGE